MKLFSLIGHQGVSDPALGAFEPDDDDGSFDLPPELATRLHRTHIAGRAVWETPAERAARLVADEEARRRDPATLLAAVEAAVALSTAALAASSGSSPVNGGRGAAQATSSPPTRARGKAG